MGKIKGGDYINPKNVKINREKRQRKEIDTTGLIDSIRERGVINPIVLRDVEYVTPDDLIGTLVAGERRLTAALELGLNSIPYRNASDLTLEELELIELEENTKRSDLCWQDSVCAHARIYQIKKAANKKLTLEVAAKELAITSSTLSKYVDLAEAINSGDKNIATAAEISQAYTILTRRKSREADAMLNSIMDIAAPSITAVAQPEIKTTTVESSSGPETVKLVEKAAPLVKDNFRIENKDSIEFMSNYSGPRFNLIHCDLPYGVALNGQANQAAYEGGGYDSNPEIYWELCAALCKNMNKLVGVSAHIMFWISMKFYEDTIAFFAKNAPQVNFNPTPLIWFKTDNKGMVPDPRRMPKNVYEAALLGSIGDRFIVKPVANVYGSPTGKADAIHTNEKPEPMLKHFFSMLVDEHTVMFDPTCGSGSSVRAAELCGAKSGLGLELNPDFAQRAQTKLEASRNLRNLSEKINAKVDI